MKKLELAQKTFETALRWWQMATSPKQHQVFVKDFEEHKGDLAVLLAMIKNEPVAPDPRVTAAALKVSEALGETDVSQIRIPGVLALALLNLERAVKSTRVLDPAFDVALDQKFADTLAKKCDELAAENKRLESENHKLKGQLMHYEIIEPVPGQPHTSNGVFNPESAFESALDKGSRG